MNDSEKTSEAVEKSDADTPKPKDEPSPPVIGERFVPSYMNFDDWGVHRHDDLF
jgi:hypothetical protein